jgi:hypothetical protein
MHLQVGVGLVIPIIKFDKLISVTNAPGIRVSAKYAFSNSDASLTCNNGVSYAVNLFDDTTYDIFGFHQGTIFKYTSPDVVSGCKRLGPAPAIGGRAVPALQERDAAATLSTLTKTVSGSVSTATDTAATGYDAVTDEDPVTAESYSPGTEAVDFSNLLTDADRADLERLADAWNSTEPNEDGSEYVQLRDETGEYLLQADDEGLFHLATTADGGTTFLSYDSIIVEDEEDRLFGYYPALMDSYGVSRFRLLRQDSWPSGADVVSLMPLNYDDNEDTPGLYIAADSVGGYYYTVVCSVQGQYSKIVLVADPSPDALEELKREELRYTVFGGVVDACQPIAFMSPSPGL